MSSDKSEAFFSSQTTIMTSSSGGSKTPNVSLFQRIQWLGNILYYQIVAVLTVVMLWIFFDNNELNSVILWHMVLSVVAYIPLMAVAIISFSKENLPTQQITRNRIYWIHGILLTFSCVAVTIGCAVEVNAKTRHFESIHAILGLTSWILVLVTACGGVIAANAQVFSQYIKPLIIKLLHNFLGISGFVLGVASIIVMFKSRRYKSYLSNSAYYASYYAAGYIVIWSSLTALRSLVLQAKGLFCS